MKSGLWRSSPLIGAALLLLFSGCASVASTEPERIGYAFWRKTGEMGEIRYQIGVQLIRTIDDKLYWKLSHRILGSRPMREDRLFDPEDFAKTEKIFNDLILKVNNLFSSEI
jgi:hypothetical protein